MSDYITLVGAERIQQAGSAISQAAERMNTAASSIAETFDRHQRFLEDWLLRLEATIEKCAPSGAGEG